MSIHDAKGHLEHFCACLPTVPYADAPRPEYILKSLPGDRFKADVVLPPSINISPRRIRGKLDWSCQKMAIKDAAFRAYIRLYDAELVNKNLLPSPLPDPVVDASDVETDEVASLLVVRERMTPWKFAVESQAIVCRQALTIRGQFWEGQELPPVHLIFPRALDISMAFDLFWTNKQSIKIQIRPELLLSDSQRDGKFLSLSHLSSQRLFESIFYGKIQRRGEDPRRSPFLIVPFLETSLLQTWLTDCTANTSVENLDKLGPEWGLIRLQSWSREARPYIFRSLVIRSRDSYLINDGTCVPQEGAEEAHFEVKRLPKRLDYLRPLNSEGFNTAIEFVPAADCQVDQFPTAFAKSMLLLPSILHKLELRIVALALNRNVLPSIGFQNLELVENAICSSAASGSTNYQRLELIGDSILKFWTSAQLCAQFPGWHEGYLSRGKDRVVSNSHLGRAARDRGLDEYIQTAPFASSKWRPPTVEIGTDIRANPPLREISSKILADVVEALIGASFMDGEDEQERVLKVNACLGIFLGSVSWRSPTNNASILKECAPRGSFAYDIFTALTEITGHHFDQIILLVEALTHPSHPIGIQGSYQRLEFLGDSILDFIVVETMAFHPRQIPHFTMHLIRAAVVNAHLLAFFCLGLGLEQDRAEVMAGQRPGEVYITPSSRRTHLWEFMKHSGKRELLESQKACAKRYDKLNAAIKTRLDHGKSHPWYLLLSLRAEKFFSDIVESILGAIFIDSCGNIEACREFLERLGLLKYLRRIMAENADVMHPKERLGIVAGNYEVRYLTTSKIFDGAAQYSSTVFIDEKPRATSTAEVSKTAAETKAAQDAVESLCEKKSQSMGNGVNERNHGGGADIVE